MPPKKNVRKSVKNNTKSKENIKRDINQQKDESHDISGSTTNNINKISKVSTERCSTSLSTGESLLSEVNTEQCGTLLPAGKSLLSEVNTEQCSTLLPAGKSLLSSKTSCKTTRKECKLVITGLSYKSILDEHLGTVKNSETVEQCVRGNEKLSDTRSVEYIENINESHLNTLNTPNVSNTPNAQNQDKALQTRSEYFFDSKKNKIKLWPTMIDCSTNDILALYTNKPCRNCHHSYDTHPIGCPIKYIPHNSDSNDPKRKKIEKFLTDSNFSCESTDYFEVEHSFCSFPCIKSYIMNRLSITPSSYKYTNALTYLLLLYKKLFSLKTMPIIPSAHNTDSLTIYGGHLSILEYRNTMGLLQFDKLVNIKRPIMFASLSYIEENAARTEKDYV